MLYKYLKYRQLNQNLASINHPMAYIPEQKRCIMRLGSCSGPIESNDPPNKWEGCICRFYPFSNTVKSTNRTYYNFIVHWFHTQEHHVAYTKRLSCSPAVPNLKTNDIANFWSPEWNACLNWTFWAIRNIFLTLGVKALGATYSANKCGAT